MPLSKLKACSLSVNTSLYLVTLPWTIHGAIRYFASALQALSVISPLQAESTVTQPTSCCSHKDAKLSVTMNQAFSRESVVEFHIILHCHVKHRNCVDEEAR